MKKQISAFVVPMYLDGSHPGLVRDYNYYNNIPVDAYENELALWYFYKTGNKLDFNKLLTYNEKIQFLKLYDSTNIKTQLSDKYLVRNYVEKKIGKQYLIPLLGVWDKADDIDFSKLPFQFVLKANHGSGWNIFVQDKAYLDFKDCREQLNYWLSMHFAFNCGMEMQYLRINRKIIAEHYLGDNIFDYKCMCFDGSVKFVWVDINRHNRDRYRNIYDINWHPLNVFINYPRAPFEIDKPDNLEEMLTLATKLSQDFCHVRVDFYNVENSLFFSEMTFTPSSGVFKIFPEEFNLRMGRWINLPPKSKTPNPHYIDITP